jgi:hypothetical protein
MVFKTVKSGITSYIENSERKQLPLDLEHKREWSKEYLIKNRERINAYKREWRAGYRRESTKKALLQSVEKDKAPELTEFPLLI